MASKLVILRHGEKPDGPNSALELAPQGLRRAQFLADKYLGKYASAPLLTEPPAGFFAITPHTIETASPSAESWKLPVIAFCTAAMGTREKMLDRCTQAAADHVRSVKGVAVMVWEHKRIAGAEDRETTLRRLLNLYTLKDVPDAWDGKDFDSIWIVEFDAAGNPTNFKLLKQGFLT